MKIKASIMTAYGALLIIGGFIGHLKAQSLSSLVMGTICGLLAMGAGWALLKNYVYSKVCAIGLSSLLTLFFCYRFYSTLKFMPAGLMAIVSLGILLFLCLKSDKTRK